MKRDDLAIEHFQGDVAAHAITVLHDDGVYRHLRFAKPGTSNKSFAIVTWPGRLCFCGDMGAFVFERIPDMFEFFRHDAPKYGYWAEKCVAQDRSGIREYDSDQFRVKARELVDAEIADIDEAARAEVLEAFEDEVLGLAEDEADARRALAEFEIDGQTLSDTWELNFEEYTFRFVWCCLALVWAIKRYDDWRAQQAIGGAG